MRDKCSYWQVSFVSTVSNSLANRWAAVVELTNERQDIHPLSATLCPQYVSHIGKIIDI